MSWPSFCHVREIFEIFVSFVITWHPTPNSVPGATTMLYGLVVTLIEEWPEKWKKEIQNKNFIWNASTFPYETKS